MHIGELYAIDEDDDTVEKQISWKIRGHQLPLSFDREEYLKAGV
jgi:hypothetical protein